MEFRIVPKNAFPVRRKTVCCGRLTEQGQSVLIIEHKVGGNLQTHSVLHRSCLAAILRKMPVDDDDIVSQMEAIRRQYTEGDSVKGAAAS